MNRTIVSAAALILALLISGFAIGWQFRGKAAEQRIMEGDEQISALEDSIAADVARTDSIQILIDTVLVRVEQAPIPARVAPAVIARVDTVIQTLVPEESRAQVAEAVAEVVAEFEVKVDSLERAVLARDKAIALLHQQVDLKDSIIDDQAVQINLYIEQKAEYEVLLNRPWYRSDAAMAVYGSALTVGGKYALDYLRKK